MPHICLIMALTKLIKEGAKLTENYMDILDEFTDILELPKVLTKQMIQILYILIQK